jgi:hypothetical protein
LERSSVGFLSGGLSMNEAMTEVMDYKAFFDKNKILGDYKNYNRIAYVDSYPGVYMLEKGDLEREKVTLIFRFSNKALAKVETVPGDIFSAIKSEFSAFCQPSSVFIKKIVR